MGRRYRSACAPSLRAYRSLRRQGPRIFRACRVASSRPRASKAPLSLRRKAALPQRATHRLRKRPSRIQALETKTNIDVFVYPCGGRMRVISVIEEDPRLIKKILDIFISGVTRQLIHEARAPPQMAFFDECFDQSFSDPEF
jgi:hypothetical protein